MRTMKKINDILEDYTLDSIKKDFQNNLKLVEDFGHLVAEKSIPSQIQLEGTDLQTKYRGNLQDRFHFSIRRFFRVQILIKEESFDEVLFERDLVLKGRYHLKNIGNGAVEILSSSPYSKFGNVIRKITKPDDLSILDDEFKDFTTEEFEKSTPVLTTSPEH